MLHRTAAHAPGLYQWACHGIMSPLTDENRTKVSSFSGTIGYLYCRKSTFPDDNRKPSIVNVAYENADGISIWQSVMRKTLLLGRKSDVSLYFTTQPLSECCQTQTADVNKIRHREFFYLRKGFGSCGFQRKYMITE